MHSFIKNFLLLSVISLAWMNCFSQQSKFDFSKFEKAETDLKVLGDSVMKGSTDLVREGAVAALNASFFDLLSDPVSYDFPFDSLKTISKLNSPDGNVRLFTWICPNRMDGTFKYYGLVQRKNPKSHDVKLIGFQEAFFEKEVAETSQLKTENWYGAIYYDIIEKKAKKNTSYLLLGWHGNDRLTTQKLIEVMNFDLYDNITFGSPVFREIDNKIKNRIIFQFTADATMLLRYEKNKKMIVFDHLSPSSPAAKGQYRYYGPDFTYDGYFYKKGFWNYKSNLDLRNNTGSK